MGTVIVFLAMLRCVVFVCVCKYAAHALVRQKLTITRNVDHVEFPVVKSTFKTPSVVRCGVICVDHESFYYVNSTRTCHCNTKRVCQANSTTSTDIVLTQATLEELTALVRKVCCVVLLNTYFFLEFNVAPKVGVIWRLLHLKRCRKKPSVRLSGTTNLPKAN